MEVSLAEAVQPQDLEMHQILEGESSREGLDGGEEEFKVVKRPRASFIFRDIFLL